MLTSGIEPLVAAPPSMNEPRTSDPIDELLRRGYRYALSLTHDPTLSEDLLQEACLRISRRSGPWHAAYLFKTIRNLRIDASRLGARQPVEPLVGDGPRAPTPMNRSGAPTNWPVPSPSCGPKIARCCSSRLSRATPQPRSPN